jgi:hypothetical protein
MNTVLETLADLTATATGLALDHTRGLVSLVLAVTLLLGAHSMLHHIVASQAANAALLDQLTRPAPPGAVSGQQWIPVQ